jgi:Ca-activated chloride channel family protein
MSKQTNCILVHRRIEADKATEQAELHRVSSMLAAGWGGLGTVREAALSYSLESRVMFSRSLPSPSAADIHFSLADDAFEVPAFLRKADLDQEPATLAAMARSVADHIDQSGSLQSLAESCGDLNLHADARRAIDDVVNVGLSVDQAWLLLAHWVNVRAGGLADVGLKALLQPMVNAVDPAIASAATKVFERQLGGYPNDGWTLTRVQRLRRALGRMGT